MDNEGSCLQDFGDLCAHLIKIMSLVEVRMKMQFFCDAATCRVVNSYYVSKDPGNFIFGS